MQFKVVEDLLLKIVAQRPLSAQTEAF